jgi:hypothetical protein
MANEVQRSHAGATDQLDIQLAEGLCVDEGRQCCGSPSRNLLREGRSLVRGVLVPIDHRQFPGEAREPELPRRGKAGRAGPNDQVSRHFQLLIDSDGARG